MYGWSYGGDTNGTNLGNSKSGYLRTYCAFMNFNLGPPSMWDELQSRQEQARASMQANFLAQQKTFMATFNNEGNDNSVSLENTTNMYDPFKNEESDDEDHLGNVFKKQPVKLIRRKEKPPGVQFNLGGQAGIPPLDIPPGAKGTYCELCDITCLTERSYRQHCSGLLHAQRMSQASTNQTEDNDGYFSRMTNNELAGAIRDVEGALQARYNGKNKVRDLTRKLNGYRSELKRRMDLQLEQQVERQQHPQDHQSQPNPSVLPLMDDDDGYGDDDAFGFGASIKQRSIVPQYNNSMVSEQPRERDPQANVDDFMKKVKELFGGTRAEMPTFTEQPKPTINSGDIPPLLENLSGHRKNLDAAKVPSLMDPYGVSPYNQNSERTASATSYVTPLLGETSHSYSTSTVPKRNTSSYLESVAKDDQWRQETDDFLKRVRAGYSSKETKVESQFDRIAEERRFEADYLREKQAEAAFDQLFTIPADPYRDLDPEKKLPNQNFKSLDEKVTKPVEKDVTSLVATKLPQKEVKETVQPETKQSKTDKQNSELRAKLKAVRERVKNAEHKENTTDNVAAPIVVTDNHPLRQTKDSSGAFYCPLCGIFAQGRLRFHTHIQSDRHMKLYEEMKSSLNPTRFRVLFGTVPDGKDKYKVPDQNPFRAEMQTRKTLMEEAGECYDYRCPVCDIKLTDTHWEEHLLSQQHSDRFAAKKKLLGLEQFEKRCGFLPSPPYSLDIVAEMHSSGTNMATLAELKKPKITEAIANRAANLNRTKSSQPVRQNVQQLKSSVNSGTEKKTLAEVMRDEKKETQKNKPKKLEHNVAKSESRKRFGNAPSADEMKRPKREKKIRTIKDLMTLDSEQEKPTSRSALRQPVTKATAPQPVASSLSPSDQQICQQLMEMTGLRDAALAARVVQMLRNLDPEVLALLASMDSSMVQGVAVALEAGLINQDQISKVVRLVAQSGSLQSLLGVMNTDVLRDHAGKFGMTRDLAEAKQRDASAGNTGVARNAAPIAGRSQDVLPLMAEPPTNLSSKALPTSIVGGLAKSELKPLAEAIGTTVGAGGIGEKLASMESSRSVNIPGDGQRLSGLRNMPTLSTFMGRRDSARNRPDSASRAFTDSRGSSRAQPQRSSARSRDTSRGGGRDAPSARSGVEQYGLGGNALLSSGEKNRARNFMKH